MLAIGLAILFTLILKFVPFLISSVSEGSRFVSSLDGALSAVVDCMQFQLPPQLLAAFAISIALTVFFRVFKLNA